MCSLRCSIPVLKGRLLLAPSLGCVAADHVPLCRNREEISTTRENLIRAPWTMHTPSPGPRDWRPCSKRPPYPRWLEGDDDSTESSPSPSSHQATSGNVIFEMNGKTIEISVGEDMCDPFQEPGELSADKAE